MEIPELKQAVAEYRKTRLHDKVALPDEIRREIKLVHNKSGKSIAEIADAIGLSGSTVGKIISARLVSEPGAKPAKTRLVAAKSKPDTAPVLVGPDMIVAEIEFSMGTKARISGRPAAISAVLAQLSRPN